MKTSEEEFYRITAEEASKDFDPLELVYPRRFRVFEKYDEYVPDELVRKGFALGVLDIEGMKERVLGWSKFINRMFQIFGRKAGAAISTTKQEPALCTSAPVVGVSTSMRDSTIAAKLCT